MHRPAALAWLVKLTTMAALIDAQESPLGARQVAYLKSQLLGGMGSLSDLWFDSKILGDVARDLNARLEKEGTPCLQLSGDLEET